MAGGGLHSSKPNSPSQNWHPLGRGAAAPWAAATRNNYSKWNDDKTVTAAWEEQRAKRLPKCCDPHRCGVAPVLTAGKLKNPGKSSTTAPLPFLFYFPPFISVCVHVCFLIHPT